MLFCPNSSAERMCGKAVTVLKKVRWLRHMCGATGRFGSLCACARKNWVLIFENLYCIMNLRGRPRIKLKADWRKTRPNL